MKKTVATLIIIIITVASLHAFRVMQQSAIKGKIYPADGYEVVMAINGTDSLKVKPADGGFNFVVKPGAWKIWVDAKAPLKDVTVDADAKEGQTVDLGEIKLQQ
jgi:hypothetical protein